MILIKNIQKTIINQLGYNGMAFNVFADKDANQNFISVCIEENKMFVSRIWAPDDDRTNLRKIYKHLESLSFKQRIEKLKTIELSLSGINKYNL